jgi:CHAD domain-containing protein
MAKKKKWEIENINKQLRYDEASLIVLNQRLITLLHSIRLFFEEESVENLHEIRISLRRLRYSMETFLICFDQKKFMRIYKIISNLQDLTGSLRDLDVLTENVNILINEKGVKVTKKFQQEIELKKNDLREEIKISLIKFIHSKSLSSFKKMLQ